MSDEHLRILYLVLLLLIIAGFGFGRGRLEKRTALRHALIWLGIIFGLMLVYQLFLQLFS